MLALLVQLQGKVEAQEGKIDAQQGKIEQLTTELATTNRQLDMQRRLFNRLQGKIEAVDGDIPAVRQLSREVEAMKAQMVAGATGAGHLAAGDDGEEEMEEEMESEGEMEESEGEMESEGGMEGEEEEDGDEGAGLGDDGFIAGGIAVRPGWDCYGCRVG